jgi:transposase InsO family protein
MGYTPRTFSAGNPMPWNESDRMSLRREFLSLAGKPGCNLSLLCQRFGISRKTAYKWLDRGVDHLEDRSRRPHRSPGRTDDAVEAAVLAVRDAHPAWGPRKLGRVLRNHGHTKVPAPSTIGAILRRHGRIDETATAAATPYRRFEHDQPNALWQMDFKGHVDMLGARCHPLTVVDDHSRYNLVLQACRGETMGDVQPALTACFRRYGLPARISCDNGPPWGTMQREDRLTRLGAWLLRLGIGLSHARPCHPQTNGKDERFHRTLNRELLQSTVLRDLESAQNSFDAYRLVYNHERPHDALGLEVPASRYRPSLREFPERLEPIEYAPGLAVRKVDACGFIAFQGQSYRVSKALSREKVAIRPKDDEDGIFEVIYVRHRVRTLDLTDPASLE